MVERKYAVYATVCCAAMHSLTRSESVAGLRTAQNADFIMGV
jgi:hypothetical protein